MSDWFFVSAWYENGETEIHFEIANEDGEQYFFWLSVDLINERLNPKSEPVLDAFYYIEEDMLALAVTILDEEIINSVECIEISHRLFSNYAN